MAAYLLGLWDGTPDHELDAVRMVKGKSETGTLVLPPSPPVHGGSRGVVHTDEEVENAVGTFHRYLMSNAGMLEFLKGWRHFNERTIIEHRLGWTGSHFTIPVPSVSGAIRGIRYRAHPAYRGISKYEGLAGRNEPCLFSLPHVARGSSNAHGELWTVEGEFDSLSVMQLGGWSATVTNGASSLFWLPEQIAHLSVEVRRWIIATDQDEKGEEAAWEIAQKVRNPYRAYWSAGKDMNEYMIAGGDLDSVAVAPMKVHTTTFA